MSVVVKHERLRINSDAAVVAARKRRKLQCAHLEKKAPLKAPDIDELLTLLNELKFDKKARPGLGSASNEYLILGLSHMGGTHVTKSTWKYPDLVALLVDMLHKSGSVCDVHNGDVWKDGKSFTSIFIGKNNKTPPHVDNNNQGVGFTFCCGNFDNGGELLVRCESVDVADVKLRAPTDVADVRKGKEIPFKKVFCKGAIVAFNGKVIHATSDWSGGDRFVIVYYSRALTRSTNPGVFSELQRCGFSPREEGWDPDSIIMGYKCGYDEEYMIDQQGLRVPLIDEAVKTEPNEDVAGELQSVAMKADADKDHTGELQGAAGQSKVAMGASAERGCKAKPFKIWTMEQVWECLVYGGGARVYHMPYKKGNYVSRADLSKKKMPAMAFTTKMEQYTEPSERFLVQAGHKGVFVLSYTISGRYAPELFREGAVYDKVVMHFKLREIRGLWIGFDCGCCRQHGDAVLISLTRGKNKYILISEDIVEFDTQTPIQDFITISGDVGGCKAFAVSTDRVHTRDGSFPCTPSEQAAFKVAAARARLGRPWKREARNEETDSDESQTLDEWLCSWYWQERGKALAPLSGVRVLHGSEPLVATSTGCPGTVVKVQATRNMMVEYMVRPDAGRTATSSCFSYRL